VFSVRVATALVWLINTVTNLAYYQRLAWDNVSPADNPTRLVGYLGRTGIADAWRELVHEEEVREAGWLTSRVRLLRRNVRRVLSRPSV
jgi:hypothetical protein